MDSSVKKDMEELTEKLITAAGDGNTYEAGVLIASGADVNACGADGWPALMHAVNCNKPEMVKLLIESGADTAIKDKNGMTAFTYAVWKRNSEITEYLIGAKADMDTADHKGETALMTAAWNGYDDIVKILVTRGADVEKADKFGWTALHNAAWNSFTGIMEMLVRAGGDLYRKSDVYDNNRTPLMLLKERYPLSLRNWDVANPSGTGEEWAEKLEILAAEVRRLDAEDTEKHNRTGFEYDI